MTPKRWPILKLDDGATEAQIRRAYARRLREGGPDADVASFQALRGEFEAALETVRSGARIAVTSQVATGRTTLRAPDTFRVRTDDTPPAPAPAPAQPPPPPDSAQRIVDEIRHLLTDGDLRAACERYDRARTTSEIGLVDEAAIEFELARAWLSDTTLGDAVLIEIVRRYRWDDAVSRLPLGREILARLQSLAVLAVARPEPGRQFVGRWNWGAFLLTPFWLIAHGLRPRGMRLLALSAVLMFVPLGFVVVIWLAIDAGRTGNALAVKHRIFRDDAHFVAVQNTWRNRGWFFWGALSATFVAVFWIVAVAR